MIASDNLIYKYGAKQPLLVEMDGAAITIKHLQTTAVARVDLVLIKKRPDRRLLRLTTDHEAEFMDVPADVPPFIDQEDSRK